MAIDSLFADLGGFDALSARDSAIHRLDPRAKILATGCFLAVVVSFGKYEVSALLPFFLYPVALFGLSGLPAGPILRKLLIAAPFALFVGLFNPLLDREVHAWLFGQPVSGGVVSFVSIQLRFLLTVGAALLLLATTGMAALAEGLRRLGAPRLLAAQLALLYRYLFVLAGEAGRMARARSLRSFGRRGLELRAWAGLVGHLLLRALDRAERVHQSMRCRGFDGRFRTLKPMRFSGADALFVLGWGGLFLLLRLVDLPRLLGSLSLELLR